MKRYRIETAPGGVKLEELINIAIKEGWEPFGGVSVSESWEVYQNVDSDRITSSYSQIFAQALVKDD